MPRLCTAPGRRSRGATGLCGWPSPDIRVHQDLLIKDMFRSFSRAGDVGGGRSRSAVLLRRGTKRGVCRAKERFHSACLHGRADSVFHDRNHGRALSETCFQERQGKHGENLHRPDDPRSAPMFSGQAHGGAVHIARQVGRRPLVTSGHRSNGRRGSYHRKCLAADIRIPGVSVSRIVAAARSAPAIGGIGTYCNGIVHVDVGPSRRWNYCGGLARLKKRTKVAAH